MDDRDEQHWLVRLADWRSRVFRSNEPGSTFRCRLDGRKAAACRSPKGYTGLAPGWHTFKVYAVDPAGNADPDPAIVHFKIANPKPEPRKG